MYNIKSTLPMMDLTQKTVFLRADFNVPLENNRIQSDFKLQAEKPTLDLLLEKKAHVVIATHLGRPKGHGEKFSTKHLLPWFERHGYTIEFAETPQEAAQKVKNNNLVLLENLRFFEGEKSRSEAFALELQQCGTFYVNDAFGTLHRQDTSVTLLPQLYKKDKKTVGLLIEKELEHLHKLRQNPQRPFVAILGGGKVETKLSFIKKMLNKVDTILLCPALVFTLLKALGKPVGKSLVDDSLLHEMKEIWDIPSAPQTIKLPTDYQIVMDNRLGRIAITPQDSFPDNAIGTAIGPETLQDFAHIIQQAHTIFFNAAMGFSDYPETTIATKQLLIELANSNAYTVVGGGDSVAQAYATGQEKKINFLSTGGGATLAYISGATLPGLASII